MRSDGDFALQHFSIDHDRRTLLPFIQAARRHQPDLRLWASPWTPPSWMKRNHFYAEAKAYPGQKDNGIRPDQIGHEGDDLFIQEPRYFDAYARYFGRFVDAYRAEGIPVTMVMPQNEFNSAQNFPSCTWTAPALARFLRYLGPEMQKRSVDIFFGTLERGNVALVRTAMADREVARFIKGVGVQWAGKNALPALHRDFPALAVYQSEQECGDGSNRWSYTNYCWHLMKHYFRSGVSAYLYWNLSTDSTGLSTWGWAQNSLVSVDTAARTYRYNHDYYLLKHLTHFVDRGAQKPRDLAVRATMRLPSAIPTARPSCYSAMKCGSRRWCKCRRAIAPSKWNCRPIPSRLWRSPSKVGRVRVCLRFGPRFVRAATNRNEAFPRITVRRGRASVCLPSHSPETLSARHYWLRSPAPPH